jgi:hypothetical protein
VAAGFYRTCVIDAVLEHSPAEHVRWPNVPPESSTLGFTHLQFEALLTAAQLAMVRRLTGVEILYYPLGDGSARLSRGVVQ